MIKETAELPDVVTGETVLRPLEAGDLPSAQSLMQSFGWPHRVEDLQFMLRVGRGFAAERGGALVGTGIGWSYGTDWAAMGSMAVAPAAQGHGIGRRIAEAILAGFGGRSVLLHATEAGLPLYAALGFVAGGTVRQHQGAAFGAGVIALEPGERLRPIGRSDPPILAALDQAATGMDRVAIVKALLETAAGVVLDRDGVATGFALLRRFGRGHVIGPVVAQNAERARALIGHFLASRQGQFMRVDVPEDSGLSAWLEGLGLEDAGTVIRMVRGPEPPLQPSVRCFALISQSFG